MRKIEKGKSWREASEEEKKAYIDLLMWITNADGSFPLEQRKLVVDMLDKIGLKDFEKEEALKKFFQKPSPVVVRQSLEEFRNNPLRFSLMGDIITLALADDVVVAKEKNVIDKVASTLNITREQLQSIYLTILEAKRIMKENIKEEEKRKRLKMLNNPLLGVGLPLILSVTLGWNVGGITFLLWLGGGTISFVKKILD